MVDNVEVGTRPKILVTGIKHTGTTFMINYLRELGFDWGDEKLLTQWSPGHGQEYAPWLELSQHIGTSYSYPNVDEHETNFESLGKVVPSKRPMIRSMFGDQVQKMDFPEIVKTPDFAAHCVWDIVDPGHVIVMHRPAAEWVQAMSEHKFVQEGGRDLIYNYYAQMMGLIYNELETHQIPYTTISYPRCVRDREYLMFNILRIASKVGKPVLLRSCFEAFDNVVDEKLIDKQGPVPTDEWGFLDD